MADKSASPDGNLIAPDAAVAAAAASSSATGSPSATPPVPPPPRRGPGHRGAEVKDTVAEMAAKAHEISLEAGSKMAAAMKDVVNAAAGLSGFVLESARDLVQYMVRRGQMTQEEADKLIRQAEEAQGGRPVLARPAAAPPPAKPPTVAKAASLAPLHLHKEEKKEAAPPPPPPPPTPAVETSVKKAAPPAEKPVAKHVDDKKPEVKKPEVKKPEAKKAAPPAAKAPAKKAATPAAPAKKAAKKK